jgi:hypothetical protein
MKTIRGFEEFLVLRDIKIKNPAHERIARLFYPYSYFVTGDRKLLPGLIGKLLGIDLSDTVTKTSCLNGIVDGSKDPLGDVDLYIRFENDVRIFIYGTEKPIENAALAENEYVLFVPGNNLAGKAKKIGHKRIYVLGEGG